MADKGDINLTWYPNQGRACKHMHVEKSPQDPAGMLSQATCLIPKPTRSLPELHKIKRESHDFKITLMINLQNNLSNTIPEFQR